MIFVRYFEFRVLWEYWLEYEVGFFYVYLSARELTVANASLSCTVS